MSLLQILPIVITGLTIATLHAAIPTHWLPFVIASRTQKWSWSKTQSILMIAGLGHIIMTTILGSIIFVLGLGFFEKYQNYFLLLASSSIGLYGLYQVTQHFQGRKHSHCKHTHHHHHAEEFQKSGQDGWAILSLLSLLTFSPCESFLPVYLSAVHFGWQGFMILSLILAVGTLLSMLTLTWVSLHGLSRFKMTWVEDNEKLVSGLSLIVLSIIFFMMEKHQH